MKKKLSAKQMIKICEKTIAFEESRIKNSKKKIAECQIIIADIVAMRETKGIRPEKKKKGSKKKK